MATTDNQILQHPAHQHPLELQHDLSNQKGNPGCGLCRRTIWRKAYYYTCREGCGSADYYHRACVEAPPRIDRHPLHPEHTLTLTHGIRPFTCDDCCRDFVKDSSSFRCDECEIDLDTGCALSKLPDVAGSKDGKTSEQIILPIHPHTLTSFHTRHDFVGGTPCYICLESVEEDGYTCLRGLCEFVIHKRCVQDLYYQDGAKAPTVYHRHQMEIHTSSKTCASCGSDESGEFIGCDCCGVFYHRQCFQVPEIITYPIHSPDHRLVLSLDIGSPGDCESCSSSLENQIYYRCPPCDFLVHIECASKVLAYVEEGMSHKIDLSWHKHQLFLCYRTESSWYECSYCRYDSIGPTYKCKEQGCVFALHKRCTEMESTVTHPHHPDHPISLGERDDGLSYRCQACEKTSYGLKFSCERCLFDLHIDCSGHFPIHKHYLHEHMLLRLERFPYAKCNRCCKSTADSIIFRCVPCNFILHEECMELPRVVKSKIHWHSLTLQSVFLEDDSGEYYCEECEQTRDPRLGVYVCGQCHISIPRIYHIHCVLPELAHVYVNRSREESLLSAVAEVNEQIANKKEKLEETKRELDELEKERGRLLKEIMDIRNEY